MPNETHHKPRKPFRDAKSAPRVGIPWRTLKEEEDRNLAKIKYYYDAVEAAGGEPVPISLSLAPAELERLAKSLDAVVLPGSPADVNPRRYGTEPHAKCEKDDSDRERTDYALLDYAFAQKKPVLAICYGVQSLNVFLGGTLIQDIPSELGTQIRHDKRGLPSGAEDPRHPARIEPSSRLATLASTAEAEVNSSHHQAILFAGKNLRVTARAPDGVIEAVEWVGDANWAVGVQWHPERMARDALAVALFRELIVAARSAVARS